MKIGRINKTFLNVDFHYDLPNTPLVIFSKKKQLTLIPQQLLKGRKSIEITLPFAPANENL